jgi:putative NADPH-quinone reductase
MKKTVVIVAHPNIEKGSLANKIIVDALLREEMIEIRDLSMLYPDFVIDVAAEQHALMQADTVVFQFPFYWYSTPAILKQWQDQVLSYGFAYGNEGDKLKGKMFIASLTIGGPLDAYKEGGYNNFTIESLLTPLEQMANLTKMQYLPPVKSYSMVYIPNVYNEKHEVQERALSHANELLSRLKQQ